MRTLGRFWAAALIGLAVLWVSTPAQAQCINTGSYTCPNIARGTISEGQLQALNAIATSVGGGGLGGGAVTQSGAWTVTPTSAAVTKTAATVGVTSAQALAGGSRRYLKICNESGSNFAAYNFAATAALNTAGNKTLVPYQCDEYDASFVPSDAINMIASGASTPVTILSN